MISYNDAVAKGLALVKLDGDLKWQLGELISELLGPQGRGKAGNNNGARVLVERWRRDVDAPWSAKELLRYSYVHDRWPENKRKNASWSTHYFLAGKPNRFKIIKDGMNSTEARRKGGSQLSVYKVTGQSSDHDLMRAAASYIKTVTKRVTERNGLKKGTEEVFGEDVAEIEFRLEALIDAAGMSENLKVA